MRDIDHVRKEGYLAAFRELARKIAIEDARLAALERKKATVIPVDFTERRSSPRAQIQKRRA